MHKSVWNSVICVIYDLANLYAPFKRLAVRNLSHILRLCLAILIAVQMGLGPAEASTSASRYICSPSGHAPSVDATAQLEALFAAAGKDLPQETAEAPHCESCVTSVAAILPVGIARKTTPFARFADSHPRLSLGFHYAAQGPPLGGRAPPLFF